MEFLRVRVSSKVAILAAVTVATAGAAGCSPGSSRAAQPLPPEKASITVCDFPAIDSAGLYIAQQQGYFTKFGLNVTIIPQFSSPQTVAYIQAKKCDISSADYVTYVDAAASQGVKLRIIAEASTLQPSQIGLMVPAGSSIRTLGDLSGKTIAVSAAGDIATLLVKTLLAENGVSNVRFAPGTQLPSAAAALASGHAVAAPIPDPFLTQGEEQFGLTELADVDQGADEGFPIQGYAVMQSWAQQYPNTLHDFLAALEQGQNEADVSRGAVETAITGEKFLGISRENAALVALPGYPLSMDPQRLQRVPDAMERFGLLLKPFKISAILGS